MKLMKNTLQTVSNNIAIGDCKAMIKIPIGDLFSNGNRDRDLKFDQIAITIFAIGVMPCFKVPNLEIPFFD